MGPMTILEMALNLATNSCFGLAGTKWGEQRSGKLMGASVVLSVAEFCLQLFMGGNAKPQAQSVGVSSQELKSDLDHLRNQLDDDLFNTFEIDKLAKMQVHEEAYKHCWDAICKSLHSATDDAIVDDELNKDWAAYANKFKQEVVGPGDSETLLVVQWLADYPKRKYDTLSLYMLAAGLYINICQMNLLIEFSHIQSGLENDTSPTGPNAEYRKNLIHWKRVEIPAYRKAMAEYEEELKERQANYESQFITYGGPNSTVTGFNPQTQSGGPIVSPPPPPKKPEKPPRPAAPPHAFDELVTSPFAQAIRDKVSDFIGYADPLVTEIEAKIKERDQLNKQVLSSITITKGTTPEGDPNGGAITNSLTGDKGRIVPLAAAQNQAVIEKGILAAGLTKTGASELKHVTDDQVTTYRKIVTFWQDCEKNYAMT